MISIRGKKWQFHTVAKNVAGTSVQCNHSDDVFVFWASPRMMMYSKNLIKRDILIATNESSNFILWAVADALRFCISQSMTCKNDQNLWGWGLLKMDVLFCSRYQSHEMNSYFSSVFTGVVLAFLLLIYCSPHPLYTRSFTTDIQKLNFA